MAKVTLPEGLTLDEIVEATIRNDCVGFCLACGEEAACVEPDARHFVCESCGQPQVFGAEELLIMVGE